MTLGKKGPDNSATNGNGLDDDEFGELQTARGTASYDEDELELADEEERLPWLESAEYDDEEPGNDTGRIVGFALLALLVLAALIAIIWWLSNRSPDPEIAPDGSTIAAAEGNYKERPDDPGGRLFEGAGDVAPAVGQGEIREGRLAAQDADDVRPSVDIARNGDTVTVAPNEVDVASTSADDELSGVGVQVAAYSTRADAEIGWGTLQRQTDALSGFKYRVVEGQADIGRVFRLQAVAGDAAAANALCTKLKSDGLQCQVKNRR